MELLYDWKMWLFLMTVGGHLINWRSNYKIQNNHLRHVDLDLKELKSNNIEVNEKLNRLIVITEVSKEKVENLEKEHEKLEIKVDAIKK